MDRKALAFFSKLKPIEIAKYGTNIICASSKYTHFLKIWRAQLKNCVYVLSILIYLSSCNHKLGICVVCYIHVQIQNVFSSYIFARSCNHKLSICVVFDFHGQIQSDLISTAMNQSKS